MYIYTSHSPRFALETHFSELVHQENCIYIIEEKNWRIILYYLELAQINANYMTLHFLLNQKGPGKF